MNDTPSQDDITEYLTNSKHFEENFEIKEFLGQGAFGRVIHVRNKIDSNDYAIKIIALPMESKEKLEESAKEARCLSNLSHPNIVQYCTTFIGRFSDPESDCYDNYNRSSSTSSTDSGDVSFRPSNDIDIIHSWHTNNDKIFSNDDQDIYSCEQNLGHQQIPRSLRGKAALFIQMEFCDNKTLRNLIDGKTLYRNLNLIKTLLRQIIDALEFIHSKEVIHRDLKPTNIFLTSENVPKIGDFGLAKSGGIEVSGNRTHSGKVGTPLYVAPEAEEKPIYGRFTDIYSLGVIIFEMVHEPFSTEMERIEALTNIRKYDFQIPQGVFQDKGLETMTTSMLSHSFESRPSAKELSENETLPEKQEEIKLRELFQSIYSGPDSSRRQQLLHELFVKKRHSRELRAQYELNDLADSESHDSYFIAQLNDIIQRMSDVFATHGALQIPLPFLLPETAENSFSFLSCSGYLQSLPYNLKDNLIRHAIKTRIKNQKCFSFSQVFRKQPNNNNIKKKNPNPKQILEASFDIVSSDTGTYAAAESLQVVLHVLRSIPYFKELKKIIYINHTAIIKTILSWFKIEEKHHESILKILSDNEGKLNDHQFLRSRGVKSADVCRRLMNLFMLEGAVHDILKEDQFKSIFEKSVGKSKHRLSNGLREVIQVLNLAFYNPQTTADDNIIPNRNDDVPTLLEKLRRVLLLGDRKNTIKIRFGLVNDPSTYNGFMFRIILQTKKVSMKYRVIAEGGDFSCLFDKWKNEVNKAVRFPKACGVSFLLEDMAAIEFGVAPDLFSVAIYGECKTGSSWYEKENFMIHKMLTILWENDIKARCTEYGINSRSTVIFNTKQRYIKLIQRGNYPMRKFEIQQFKEVVDLLLRKEEDRKFNRSSQKKKVSGEETGDVNSAAIK